MEIATLSCRVPEHTERFSFASGRLPAWSRPNLTTNGIRMVFEPVYFALLLTAAVLAVIFGILIVERLWLSKRNNGNQSEDYRMSVIEY